MATLLGRARRLWRLGALGTGSANAASQRKQSKRTQRTQQSQRSQRSQQRQQRQQSQQSQQGEQGDRGQISLLILGFTVIALILIIGGVDVTSVQLARARLLDAADGAALEASDTLDNGSAYNGGLRSAVAINDESVRSAAAAYLAVEPRPHGISSWVLTDGTGSPDGQTAVVRLRGTAEIPIAASVVAVFGGSVDITVESRARSGLR